MGFLMLLEQHQDREGKPSLDQRIQTYSNKLKKKKKTTQNAYASLIKKTITMSGVNIVVC